MKIWLAFILFGAITSKAALPHVPLPDQVRGYFFVSDSYRYRDPNAKLGSRDFEFQISKQRGDALLEVLAGGGGLREKNSPLEGASAFQRSGTNIICVIPARPDTWLSLILTNGDKYNLGIGNGFVDLPVNNPSESRCSMFIVKEEARQRLSNSVSQINVDVRHEIVTAPRPLTYIIGTVEDGCTLSGIARMFYGDAGKWKQIYEANRKTLKNPNLIESGIKLIIPATAVSTGVTHQNSK